MLTNEEPVIVEQYFNAKPERIWKSITEHSEMIKWYFDNIPEFIPEVGFKTRFVIENEGRKFTHKWKITEVEPLHKIAYEWEYDEYSGRALVVFEIIPENDKTKLRLSNYVHEDFPDGIPEFKRESCVGGWTYFINGNLKEYLAQK